jgi:hypothetical protein
VLSFLRAVIGTTFWSDISIASNCCTINVGGVEGDPFNEHLLSFSCSTSGVILRRHVVLKAFLYVHILISCRRLVGYAGFNGVDRETSEF